MLEGEFTIAGKNIIAAVERSMTVAATKVMKESDRLIPKDTLTALESGRIFPVIDRGVETSVTFGYGYGDAINPITKRPAAAYIVPLHEILDAKHRSPTQAKFLETAMFAYSMEMEEDIGRRVKTELSMSLFQLGVNTTMFDPADHMVDV